MPNVTDPLTHRAISDCPCDHASIADEVKVHLKYRVAAGRMGLGAADVAPLVAKADAFIAQFLPIVTAAAPGLAGNLYVQIILGAIHAADVTLNPANP